MKNLTITLDDRSAAWLRVNAARAGVSASRFVSALLERRMDQVREYNQALARFQSLKPFTFSFDDGSPPSRADLHDRAGLR